MRTLETMVHFLLVSGTVVPGWPVLGGGHEIGDVNKDAERISRARDAGKNMAWLLKSMERARGC
jgi:hypothetical protein